MTRMRTDLEGTQTPTINVGRPDARDPIISVLRASYAAPDEDMLPDDMLIILQQIDAKSASRFDPKS